MFNFKSYCKMAKRHDESKCLRTFARIGKVSYGDKTLQAPKSAIIGIHLLGKIDYLTHYCGWKFYWNNSVTGGGFNNNDEKKTSSRDMKKAKKEHQLSDKTKKSNKKK